MKTTFVGWNRCSTSRKAQKKLDELNIDYTFRDMMEETPTAQELTEWIEKSGLPIRRFFNTSGIQYRELGLKDKLDTMGEQEQIDLLATSGRLIKRPIVISDNTVLVGYKEESYEALI